MRSGPLLVMLLAGALLAGGCANKKIDPRVAMDRQRPLQNAWTVNAYSSDMIANGVITAHTLYPHHFEPNSAEPNALGKRDLATLARHYRDHPGKLNVRKADASDDLYQQRVDRVMKELGAAGVDTSRLSITDAQAGGDGMSSDEVVIVLAEGRSAPAPVAMPMGGVSK